MQNASVFRSFSAPPSAATEESRAAALTRARTLIPLLRSKAGDGDRDARLSPLVMDAMRSAGLFRLLQPQRYGGPELDPETFFIIQAALAEGDMSAGWLQGVMGVLAFHLALFDERAQDDVWGEDPDALLACSYMPTGKATPVGGGFRLSGRWGFASGSDYCDWLILAGSVSAETAETAAGPSGAPPDLRVFLVPRADALVHDNWDTTGLRGTGSQDVTVDAVFVPEHRAHRHVDRFLGTSPGLAINTAPLYRLPLPQLLFRTITMPAVGALRGFLDAFLDHSRARVAVTGQAVARDPVAQLIVAEIEASLDEITAMMGRNFARLTDYARRGEQAPIPQRMVYRLQATMAAERCTLLAARLFKACGASGLAKSHPFGRYLADIAAARQHAANQNEAQGRSLGALMLGVGVEDTVL
jgi:3-hydroxy-9,10-secoandrosta-1,3,5(10)-triene-9,17-dione monooxygenase